MRKSLPTALFVVWISISTTAVAFDEWEWTLEGGHLWGIRFNTRNDYRMAPAMFTLRAPSTHQFGEWTAHARASLLHAGFTRGPETRYTGLLLAPSFERKIATTDVTPFLSAGGGVGLADSSGGNEGLGHDLTLNWFAQAGVRRNMAGSFDWQASVFFLHLSNGGRTDPNPAVDALGFTLGVSRRF